MLLIDKEKKSAKNRFITTCFSFNCLGGVGPVLLVPPYDLQMVKNGKTTHSQCCTMVINNPMYNHNNLDESR